jgi:PAS domain S-box-containing protein
LHNNMADTQPNVERGIRGVAKDSAAEPHIHLQSYLRFRDLLEAAPYAILEVDRDGTIVLLNAAAEAMFGYPRDELLGQLIEILVPESLRQRHNEHRDRYAEHPTMRPMGIGLELFARRKDGAEFPVEISLSPIRSTDGSRVMAIVRDITDRRQAQARIDAVHQEFAAALAATNQRLEEQNRELERANRLKSEFLASMSHELRTPLHTIIGFGDLLAEELKGALNADQKRFVTHIQHDSRHLLELINDILDLSKIEAGRLELHPELLRPADAVTQTITSLRPLANNKAISIVEDVDREVHITADPVRFKEIVSNLVSNAIKFTPEGGRIRVECHRRAHHAVFAVTDTGIGVPASEQQAIFDKFYQLGSTTRGVREGTGLGLAITKRLVEMHGGTISVESAPGQGSRFEFVIPYVVPKAAPREMPEPARADSRSVLFLTRDEESRRRISGSLQNRGYYLIDASISWQAVKLAREAQPAAILLDLSGLGADAWQVFQKLRGDQSTEAIPILVLTPSEDERTAVSLGASAVVRKPIDSESLIQVLDKHVRRLPGEPSRVLVVDDDAEARELLDEVLRSAGLLPVIASSGKQALEVLARSPIAAAVIDLIMPEMNGFELILRIRLDGRFSQLPLIVLTGKELDSTEIEILSRQTNAVFLKAAPWKQEFLAKLDSILQNVKRQ